MLTRGPLATVSVMCAAFVSLVGADSGIYLNGQFQESAFAEIYSSTRIDWGVKFFNRHVWLSAGQLIELVRALLAVLIVRRLLLDKFRTGTRQLFCTSFDSRGSVVKCVGFSSVFLLLCAWVVLYAYVPGNAPCELWKVVDRQIDNEYQQTEAIYDETDRQKKQAELRQRRQKFQGDGICEKQFVFKAPVFRPDYSLSGTEETPVNSGYSMEYNYLEPYRWYAGYAIVLFVGMAFPFLMVPLVSVMSDLKKLQKAWDDHFDRQQDLMQAVSGESRSDSVPFQTTSDQYQQMLNVEEFYKQSPETLVNFKITVRELAERYIEYPIWFVVFAGFELAVGRHTLAEESSDLTIWFILLILMFGFVVVHIGLIYERAFRKLRSDIEKKHLDTDWLEDHTPLKFFQDFRQSSILGLAAWFAGASIVFGLVSQALNLLQ